MAVLCRLCRFLTMPFVDNNSKSHVNALKGGYIHAILLIFCIIIYQTTVLHENYTSEFP